jgi:phosphoglycerol transferase MdoB-like AlkP superfamily enzyme
MAVKNWSAVKNLSYSTAIKAYMACNIELDKALAQLIQYLSDKGILDNTVIEISGDHYPYGLTLDEMNEKSDFVRDDNFDKHKSSLVIWSSSMKEPINVDKLSSSIDILPTLLNLFGVEYDSRLLMGRDILSDADPVVIFSNRSFITDKGRYNAITSKFTSKDGSTVNQEYISQISKFVYDRFYLSRLILEQDYYRRVFKP